MVVFQNFALEDPLSTGWSALALMCWWIHVLIQWYVHLLTSWCVCVDRLTCRFFVKCRGNVLMYWPVDVLTGWDLDAFEQLHFRDERFRAEVIEVLISKATKVEMTVTVVRDGSEVTFGLPKAQASKSKRGGKKSPTLSELMNELQAWLYDHQEYQGSQLRTRFSGHSWIFTPP
jgi:hypothetical protein